MTTNTNKQTTNLTPYKQSLSVIEQKANQLSIKTTEEIKTASDILFQISSVAKRIEEEKAKIVDPLKVALLQAKKLFDPLLDQCEKAEEIIKDKMIAFDAKKQAEAQKKLSTIADKVASGKLDIEKATERIEGLKPENSYSGDAGAIQFREHRTVEIIDENKIPRHYLEPNMSLIRADALKGVEIPGVVIKVEKIVAKGKL
jgi:predicted O-linked N-acetylglucosamine transferase (SPINDLY family)